MMRTIIDKIVGTKYFIPIKIFNKTKTLYNMHLDFATPEDIQRACKYMKEEEQSIYRYRRDDLRNTEENHNKMLKLIEFFNAINKT